MKKYSSAKHAMTTPAKRHTILAAARRVLWDLVRGRALGQPRGTLRRRLGDLLRRSSAGRLWAIVRSGALAGAVAAALVAPGGARGQEVELGPIELADVARGEGGFLVRDEGHLALLVSSKVADAGDVNGDGFSDLIVGANACNWYCYDAVHFVIFGKPGSAAVELSEVLRGRGGFAIHGSNQQRYSLAGAGDINGDGLADLLVAAPHISPGDRQGAGETYVVFGKPDGEIVELSDVLEGRGGFAIRGSADGDSSGASIAGAGDVNGDGLGDLVVGAPGADPGGRRDAGESYVIFGKQDGDPVEVGDVQEGRGGFAIRGSAAYDRAGDSVSAAGDVNGDGLADLIVGMNRYRVGDCFVVFGKPDGEPVELGDLPAREEGFAIRGAADDGSGCSVSDAGDVNGDGLGDVIVGLHLADPGGRLAAGESFVVFGKPNSAPVEISDIQEGRGGFSIRGSVAYDHSGSSVSGAGDVNGDGLADVVVGARGASPGGRERAGESYVVFGKDNSAHVELAEVQAGRGGFAIRGSMGEAGRDVHLSVSGGGDVNGDGSADIQIGALWQAAGAAGGIGGSRQCHVVFGKQDGAAVELAEVDEGQGGFPIVSTPQDDRSHNVVSGAGDVNGDGLTDLVVGQFRGSAVHIVFGKAGRAAVDLSQITAGQGGFVVRLGGESGPPALSVSGAGDVNGDGLADVLIGEHLANPGGRENAGESYVVFGKQDAEAVELSEVRGGRQGFVIRGVAAGDSSGASVSAAGDVNGDGLADLVIGAHLASPGGRENAGESYVVFGKQDAEAVELFEVRAGRRGFVIRGVAAGDSSGASVSAAGDVNDDGLADLLIGAPAASPGGRERAGESYVVFGKPNGEAVELSDVQGGEGGFVLRGVSPWDLSGGSVSGAGDVNADGLADILLGAFFANPGGRENAGESYVVFGKVDGDPVEISDVQVGRGGFAIRGVAAEDHSGRSLSRAGDVNSDGFEDVLLGAPEADRGGADLAGESYVVFGKADGEAVELSLVQANRGGFAIHGTGGAYERAGQSVSGAGDMNGDGLPDLLIAGGMSENDLFNSWVPISGAVYVVFGRGEPRITNRFRRGAVRGKATLDISDGIRLLGYLFLGDLEPPCLDAADADDSGELDVSDAVRVLGYLFLGAEPPPAPGPTACGEDPTDDDLGCAIAPGGCR